MGKIDYDGTPKFTRPRKLVETNNNPNYPNSFEDKKPPQKDSRELDTDKLFKKLAATYLKGEVLKRGLSKMEPAQSIPIEKESESTIAAAVRLFKTESIDGTIITYSMYQNCIELINKKKWDSRKKYFIPSAPISTETTSKSSSEVTSNSGSNNIIQQFLDHNGIAGTIIAMLTLAPFQGVIFQALGVEKGAQTSQAIQIPVGLAILIEFGIKAERIKAILKTSKIDIPLVEQQLVRLEEPSERALALESIGIDYQEFRGSMEITDSEAIINYVSEYYTRFGGLVRPGSHLTIDHWLAYLHVSQNQQVIRGSLNTADSYSTDFANLREEVSSTVDDDRTSLSSAKDKSKISIQLASATRSLREKSNDIYDDIISAFMYQVSDDDLCCLVSIFGKTGNLDLMKTIASILRLLAVDLGGEITRLDNRARLFISNYFATAIFELVSDIERANQKMLAKLTKMFTVDIEGLERCVGLLTIGWAVMQSVTALSNRIKGLLRDIMSSLNIYGHQNAGAWTVSADRRCLLGMARILEILAARLEVASVCDNKISNGNQPAMISSTKTSEPKDMARFEVIHSILDGSPPSIQITSQEIERYFPDIQPRTSERLKFIYGIPGLQNLETQSNCSHPASKEEIDELFNRFSSAMKAEFA